MIFINSNKNMEKARVKKIGFFNIKNFLIEFLYKKEDIKYKARLIYIKNNGSYFQHKVYIYTGHVHKDVSNFCFFRGPLKMKSYPELKNIMLKHLMFMVKL